LIRKELILMNTPNVKKALDELDEEALASLQTSKIPAFRQAIKKEYDLTEEEVDYVVGQKIKTENSSSKPSSTIREKKIRLKVDNINILDSANSIRSEQDLELIDPISKQIMVNPVMMPCGHSFSEQTLASWMEQYTSCPVCNKPYSLNDFRPNFILRYKILKKYFKEDLELENLNITSLPELSEASLEKQEILLMTSLKAPLIHKLSEDPTGIPSSPGSDTPLCIVALVDTSNTQNVELFQNGIKFLLSQLNERDSFGLIVFNKDMDKVCLSIGKI